MKKFILEEILLMSSLEKKARKISFDPNINIIIGENDTGKSSLIKSIYWTFGTEVPNMHIHWKNAKVTSLVKFTVDDKRFSLLRKENFYALFNQDSELIGSYDSVTTGLGPVLADIFDFKLLLTDKKGNEIIPLPAFYLLPFYADQDASWSKNWSAFNNLGQIPRWKKPLVEYHTGIKTNEHYVIKTKIDQIKIKVNELNLEKKFFDGTLTEIKKENESLNIVLDVMAFEKEIDEMMTDLKWLQESRNNFKEKLVDKYNLRNNIIDQIKIVTGALNEARADYKLATTCDEIDCPTCGHSYENNFSDRFSIAQDENKCADLLADLNLELINTNKEIEVAKTSHEKQEAEISKLQEILARKQGQLTLNDVIAGEGRKQMKTFLSQKSDNLKAGVAAHELEITDFTKELKEVEKRGKDRKKSIMSTYLNNMRTFLFELDVQKLPESLYKKIDFDVKESGSDQPRALLAYYYSILSVMREYGSSAFAPIILDSPNQQDQDIESLKKVLTFIRDRKIADSQLIMGLTTLQGVEYSGQIITLEKKRSLLLEGEYKDVSSEINEYLSLSLLVFK